ncbi:MAG: efflux RND transporter periplasmic adaptor subunit [Acidobacteria bacterium]|nr:efflux RND transporter periplasmic adaptor subunit [Acidobacteriota bacterium]MBI3427655.1 efflux RND transporter periplasmic adaptor subunit [Acidobacteriota bacterium]
MRSKTVSKTIVMFYALCFASLSFAGCKGRNTAPGRAAAPPPPVVSVLEVALEDTPIYSEYVAQTFARDLVEVRGRVDGYIEKRSFAVGAKVRAGELLYVLDLRPYQAEVAKAKAAVAQAEAGLEFARKQVALAQSEADLAQAEANLAKAEQDVARLEPLTAKEAAPQQDLDNARSAVRVNEANVNARRASVEQARLSTRTQVDAAQAQLDAVRAALRQAELNLDYATIRAPISGRIGDSLIQVGGLVTKSSPQPLTTLIPLDPIWVRFQIAEAEHLRFVKRADREAATRVPMELILADNSVHPYKGHYQNAVNQVDPKTGTLELQATFPNPDLNVLPGQFGRVRFSNNQRTNVILVPQRALQELQGAQSVLVVGPENKVLARSVVTGERVGERRIIMQGLKPGDRVIVEGLQKARPGAVVQPKPYQASAPQ